jgi:general secretion pathway protein K
MTFYPTPAKHMRGCLPPRHRQPGLALIVAMLVAALAAAVAVSVATAQSQWSAQVAHRRDQVEAQSMLNVNDLASGGHAAQARQRFTRLFAALGVPATTLAAMADWVDTDDVVQEGGAEDAWYSSEADGSLAANAPATRFEELALVRGMTPAAMMRLRPFVTSLPADTPVNVNTAPAEVLGALLEGAEPALVATLVARRGVRPFASADDLRALLPANVAIIDPAMISVKTRYFLVSVRARQGETIAHARALIFRDDTSSSIVWQTIE